MTSIGELLMLDYQVEDLRRRIDVEKERLAQMDMESQHTSKAIAALDELEKQLETLLAQRDKTVREMEGGQHLKAS
jgi:predicted  nucleic acid-binding Zn-ribbon protein